MIWDEEQQPALGAVVEQGRGSLPFALVHGEALVACASWALGAAGVTAIDLGTPWAEVADSELPFVVHDPLCPMTPPAFLAACVARAVELDRVVVGVRPVTDTVKLVADGVVGETVDRSGLLGVASPVVLPASVVAGLAGLSGAELSDLAVLVARLARSGEVEEVLAPPEARRVASVADLRVLEALTDPR